ncbi:3-hydroxyacyl-ACP dehydratase FabZ [Candidatus Dependentiae bacterium]|nr:3-hydroxyacyl-ACP dehydratase FabZ [Candidatus Dependentiae bacterium]
MELDVIQILEILPHRYPFLMVDRVLKIEKNEKIIAIKNVTFNEQFFQGHFPGHPIMPGVLVVEGMAQAGAILLLEVVGVPKDKVVYFGSIDKVKFRKPVVPGDVLRYEVSIVNLRADAKIPSCKISGKTYVGDKLVTQAEMMAVLVDK